jgi:hypothetical protein
MFQTYQYNLSTKRLGIPPETDEVQLVQCGFTLAITLEGIFDEEECNVIRNVEFEQLFAPWFQLFEERPLNRYIKRPSAVNLAIYLATMTNRIVDTHVIRSLQIQISDGMQHSYRLDTRVPEDLAVATRGGHWRGHDLESMRELEARVPGMFTIEEIGDIADEVRTAKKTMNDTIKRIRSRRLKGLIAGGGSLTQD